MSKFINSIKKLQDVKYEDEWYNKINKSPYTPKPEVFKAVWPILYIMIVVAYIMVMKKTTNKLNITIIFILQLVVNIYWIYMFFVEKQVKQAYNIIIILVISIGIMIYLYNKDDKTSAYMMVPYILWVIFAGYLNKYIIDNNKIVEKDTEYPEQLQRQQQTQEQLQQQQQLQQSQQL